jgi:3-hydroxyisobutyrate dehydrogenase-like beta-hydroxyacid dehydrogenase
MANLEKTKSSKKIGFIGRGFTGISRTRRSLAAAYPVAIYDCASAMAREVMQARATTAGIPKKLAAGCGVGMI